MNKWVALLLGLLVLGLLAGALLGPGIDWRDTYRPAARAVIRGGTPYGGIYYAAPWCAALLAPLALLPEWMGRGLLLVTGLCVYAWCAYKAKLGPGMAVVFLLSPPVLHDLWHGNVEWMALAGAFLPPWAGVVLLAVKPQIGVGVLGFRLWQAARRRTVIQDFGPLVVLLIASVAAYGPWMLRFGEVLDLTKQYNASIWPWGIPVGLALGAVAALKDDERCALAVGPFVSPYALVHTWVGLMLALPKKRLVPTVAMLWALSWLAVLPNFSIMPPAGPTYSAVWAVRGG
jgi:hypothetical protein